MSRALVTGGSGTIGGAGTIGAADGTLILQNDAGSFIDATGGTLTFETGNTVVNAGPRKVSRSAVVHAPAGELFDVLADPRRHSELDGSGTVVTVS